ncbi:hypothetical protein ACTA71_002202 [Dictyostelium dimigraforme]
MNLVSYSIKINQENKKSFIDSIDTFIFDCDGVLWIADTIVPGAIETLNYLRHTLGKKILFVTNNSTKTRQQFLDKIKSFGIDVCSSIDQVYGSSYGAAIYLNQINFPKETKKVFIIGEQGLEKELNDQNFKTIKEINRLKDGLESVQNTVIDQDVGAVIVGMDTQLTFQKATYAHMCIKEIKDCLFIATNPDTSYPVKNEKTLPGAGSIVAMIQTSTQVKPITIGKPETLLLDVILKKENLNPDRTLFVGDRLDTDIAFAVNGGIKSLLVLTGISKLNEINNIDSKINPNYYTNTIADLLPSNNNNN